MVALESLTLLSDVSVPSHFFEKISQLTSLRALNRVNLTPTLFRQVTDADLAPLSKLVHLTSLDLSGSDLICGAGLSALSGLKNLMTLKLESCPRITNVGLVSGLATVTSLTDLSLESCNLITDKRLKTVISSVTFLRELKVVSCNSIIGDCFQRLPVSMQVLDLRDCKKLASDACFASIAALPALRVLDLSACSGISDKHLELLVAEGTKVKYTLEKLSVSDCDAVSGEALKFLSEITSLQDLKLYHSSNIFSRKVTDETIANHISKLTSLTSLDIRNNLAITDISPLKSLSFLRILRCSGCDLLTDTSLIAVLQEWKKFERLEEIALNDCAKLTDGTLLAISKIASMKSVEVRTIPAMTDDGIKQLSCLKELKFLDIYYDHPYDFGAIFNPEGTAEFLQKQLPGLRVFR